MKIITLKECKDLFPVGSFGSYRMAIHEEDYADDLVLLIEEDCTIENINLDEVYKTFSVVENDQWISIILCLGDFSANNIYNYFDDDGSCCLTVLGNLTCNNMLVGGQEVFVAKDLVVKDCFWGNYNHGLLVVKGDIIANVFLTTDEYNLEKNSNNYIVNYSFNDIDEENKEYEFSNEQLALVFKPKFLRSDDEMKFDVSSWSSWLYRTKSVDYLSLNKSIINEVIVIPQKTEADYEKILITPPNYIQTQEEFDTQIYNFERLLEVANLEPDNELEFEKYGFKFTFYKEYDNNPNIAILIAINEEFVVSISMEKSKEKTIFRKKTEASVSAYVKERNEEDGIHIFSNAAPESYYDVFNDVWKMFLYHAERGAHFYKRFLNEVKATDIHKFCTLPIITEFYNNWRDGDRNGFYFGGKKYSFCIPVEKNGSAQLRISKKIKSKNDNHDCRGFRFDNDTIENPEHVNLLYNYSQCERVEGRYKKYGGTKVYFFDDELYEEALEWYQKAQINVPKVNAIYLEDKEFYINSRD